MTEKQRNLGRLISISIVILVLIFAALSSCTPFLYKSNQVQVTHVLALTEMGDTVKIPISEIKPKIIYDVIGYNYMRYNPYYSPYNNRYYYDYYNYNRHYTNHQGIQGSGSSIQYNNISPTTQISVPSSGGSYSGTSGFSGNPVASNPVTSSGGGKKNN